MLRALVAALGLIGTSVSAVDLREYLPHGANTVLYKANGQPHSRYTIGDNHPSFTRLYQSFFDQKKQGVVSYLRKEYYVAGSWCTATYAVILKGADASVTEVGDWLLDTCTSSGRVLGYKTNPGANAGLVWADGPLTTPKLTEGEYGVYSQDSKGAYASNGYNAYARAAVIEVLPTFTPRQDGSNGIWAAKTNTPYTNVVKHVMYHGVRNNANPTQVRCVNAYAATNDAFYQSYKDYNSYAMVVWLAKGVGVIQEQLLYVEDGSYWGMSNCLGYPFNKPYDGANF
jgi:hypothetical protein